MIQSKQPSIAFDHFSDFTRLYRVTALTFCFNNSACLSTHKTMGSNAYPHLTVSELVAAENYWSCIAQCEHFLNDIKSLKIDQILSKESNPFCLFLDETNLLHIGGRMGNSEHPYSILHPIILHGNPSYH